MVDEAKVPASSRAIRRGLGIAGFVALALFIGGLVYAAVLPAYRSPESRLWSASFGFPVLLRLLDRPIPVDIAPVEKRSFDRFISAIGSVEYRNRVPVNVEVPGVVDDLLVELGQSVSAGQRLLVINSGGARVRLAQIDARMKESAFLDAQSNYLREREAFRANLISQKNYENVARVLNEARLAHEKAKQVIEDLQKSRSEQIVDAPPSNAGGEEQPPGPMGKVGILAPASGDVIAASIVVGENIISGKQSAIVIGDKLVFQAQLDQRYFSDVKIGDVARFYVDALPGVAHAAVVEQIAPIIQPAAARGLAPQQVPQTFLVWLKIGAGEQQSRRLASGMNGYMVLQEAFESVAIPQRALLRFSGGEGLVLVVDEAESVRVAPVRYSVSADGWVAVEDGLAVGDRVVASGQIGLQPGDTVVPR